MVSPREPTLALGLAIATLVHYPAIAIARLWKPNSARRDCLRAMLRLLCPAICTFLFPRRKRALLSSSNTFWSTNPSFSHCRNSRRLCAATDRRILNGEKLSNERTPARLAKHYGAARKGFPHGSRNRQSHTNCILCRCGASRCCQSDAR